MQFKANGYVLRDYNRKGQGQGLIGLLLVTKGLQECRQSYMVRNGMQGMKCSLPLLKVLSGSVEGDGLPDVPVSGRHLGSRQSGAGSRVSFTAPCLLLIWSSIQAYRIVPSQFT